jgi:signal transduction histidine kinase/ActR/RegA family two-component response regulator
MLRWFWNILVPSHLHQDRETQRQASRVAALGLAMMFWVPVFSAIYAALGAPTCAAIIVLAGLLLVAVLMSLRFGKSPTLSANAMTLLAWTTYTALSCFTGGHGAPAEWWYVSVPVMAVLLAGLRWGTCWSLVCVLSIAGFYVAREQGHTFPVELTPSGLRFLEVSGLAGILLCVFALTCVFKCVERNAQNTLEATLHRAEAADRAKGEFLANMSHEIRTPMTSILGYTDLLIDRSLDGSGSQQALRTIQRNGEHLLAIINDILDLSKIEANMLEVEWLPCSPRQIAVDVAELMRVRTDAKGLRLDVEFDGPLPAAVETDPIRLRQVLINIVGNAIKFTETGGIRLVVRCRDDGDSALGVQFEVFDTGIGMTEEQIARLFQSFSQADSSTTRRFGGTGLGLALSRRLTEMLGGTIAVRSRVGLGSAFLVTIAARRMERRGAFRDDQVRNGPRAQAATRSDVEAALAGCRVLLAEDGTDNQRLIAQLLEMAGAHVAVAENGRVAVDLAQRALDHGEPFDVLLMDMQMPVVDGYEATALLRAAGYELPIVALTAHVMAADRQKCLDAGCDDYATKPIDRKTLIAVVRKHVGGRRAEVGT